MKKFLLAITVLALLAIGYTAYHYRAKLAFFAEGCLIVGFQTWNPRDFARSGKTQPAFHVIQHAGGAVNRITYTNSLEALNLNYQEGERYFELDFDITSDQIPVCIHGWEQAEIFAGGVRNQVYSFEQFKRLKRIDGLTQITVFDLKEWLESHTDARIITDVKSDNRKALATIARLVPHAAKYFIPQIYTMSQYKDVHELGFRDIIFTRYRSDYPDFLIVAFARKYPLYAVTMSDLKVERSSLAARLKKSGTAVFAHTVNTQEEYEALKKKGVFGIYTDLLNNN